jgi:[ribosomal protein S5]-alanine N-acetyltransferase
MSAIDYPARPLSDGVLTLRPFRADDVPIMVAELNEEEIDRWTMVPQPYGPQDAHAFLAQSEAMREQGRSIGFAIEGDRLLGSIDLRVTDPEQRRGELGYLVHRRARGRGAATRAVRLVSAWGFERLGLERLEIYVQPGNEPSCRVAEGAGFRREGLLRSHRIQRGGRSDMILYARLPTDP